ncbi:Ser-Thr-rich glycosyl-phosphatidyl-inositol-anchored membrane family-domain-containing protein [Biscogniauxia mediterranea]|nr:Ser-Thr-rich glycosyl-phosphatidyl-inositol-anchored membrane family-domain-containing protein [Biscogniauxia mediterranea]
MKSVIASVFLAALAGLANAKVILTNTNYDDIEVGKAFQITWADAEGPVTITLKNGAENDLKDVSTIASGQTSGSFSWTPSTDLSGNYAFEISDGVDINYSQMFTLDGTASTTTTATSDSSSSIISTSYPSSTQSAPSTQSASSTLSTITKSSSASSTANSTASTSSGAPSSSGSSSPSTSSGAASSSSPATTTSASSTSSTHSSSATSASATASETAIPNTNDARGLVVPLFAPILVAVGAAFL